MFGAQNGFAVSYLTDPKQLFGHNAPDGLLDTLCSYLRSGSNVQLLGERRAGKTSLLQCAAKVCSVADSRLVPVYINFQVKQEVQGPSAAYYHMLASIHASLVRAHITGWPETIALGRARLDSSTYASDHYEALAKHGSVSGAELLARYVERLTELQIGILLFIDEYEYLLRQTFEGKEGFAKLRELSSIPSPRRGAPKPFSLAIAGAIHWVTMCKKLGSPEFNCISVVLEVGPIEQDGFHKMWEHCLETSAPDFREHIRAQGLDAGRAYELSGGWPFYGKLLGTQAGAAGRLSRSPLEIAQPHFGITFGRQDSEKKELLLLAARGELTRASAQGKELIRLGLLIEDEDGVITPRGKLWHEYLLERVKDEPVAVVEPPTEEAVDLKAQLCEQLGTTIADLVTEINSTNMNLGEEETFVFTNRDPSDYQTLRKLVKGRESFAAFMNALYGLCFERTKKNSKALQRLPEPFRRSELFIQAVDILRHSYGNAHIVDSPEWKSTTGTLNRGDVLLRYLNSRVEPKPTEFGLLQESLLRDAVEYLTRLREQIAVNETVLTAVSDDAELTTFQSEHELERYLTRWAERGWTDRDQRACSRGDGKSIIKPIAWKGTRHILKISPDARSLIGEANQAMVMSLLGNGQLPIVPVVAKVTARTTAGEWAGYVVQHVGEASLRDYLFDAVVGKADEVVRMLCDRLAAIYTNTRNDQAEPSLDALYLQPMCEAVEKLRVYTNFKPLKSRFDTSLIINEQQITGPAAILDKAKVPGALDKLRPRATCLVHGDLYFENIRVSSTGNEFWLLGPQGSLSGDYVHDCASMLTALTGQAHVARGAGSSEVSYPARDEVKNGEIGFNLWHTPHQRKVFRTAILEIEKHLYRVASDMERGPSVEEKKKVARQRLSLAIARQYLVATRYFRQDSEQFVVFARGAQFLDMFYRGYFLGESVELFKTICDERWLNMP